MVQQSTRREGMDQVQHAGVDVTAGTPVTWLLGRPDAASRLRREPPGRILVLGSGDGSQIEALAAAFPHVSVYGIDDDQDLLDAAVARLSRSRVRERVLCRWGSAWFPHVTMPYDVVVAVGLVRSDGSDPASTRELLRTLAGVLLPDGLAVLDTPCEPTLEDVADAGFRLIELLGHSQRGCAAYLLRL